MKVYLDDARPTPDGWVRCYWPIDVIQLLKSGRVTHLSLDHDLGDDARGTGYDVLTWIEEQVATTDFDPPITTVHSSNPAARKRMEAAVESITRMLFRRVGHEADH